MHDVILGLATGYPETVYRRFLGSLRNGGYRGRVVFFMEGEPPSDVVATCRRYRAEIEQFSGATYPLDCYRFLLYERWLAKAEPGTIGRVLLTDVRDVLFQGDVFSFPMPVQADLYYFEADQKIGGCAFNSRWMLELYDRNVLAAVSDETVTCSGSTLGLGSAILAYLRSLNEQVFGFIESGKQFTWPCDQGFHNYVVYVAKVPGFESAILSNLDGPINTLGPSLQYYDASGRSIASGWNPINPDGYVTNRRGDVSPMVHQFDRLTQQQILALGHVHGVPVEDILSPARTKPASSKVAIPFDGMGMSTPQGDLDMIAHLASLVKPAVAVEVGSWAGRTALVISDIAEKTYCVDHWKGSPWESGWVGELATFSPEKAYETFCRNMGDRLNTKVFPCRGDSLEWAASWKTPIDFLFIDSDHRYEAIKADILAWSPHVRPGGIICGHDYGTHCPGVVQAVDEIFPNRVVGGSPGSCVWAAVKPTVEKHPSRPIIVTIYQDNIPNVVLAAQRRVVSAMAPGIEFRQIPSEDLPGRYAHAVGIDRVLAEDTEHDLFLFLDVDAIPLNANIIPWMFDRASQGVLVGPAQRANHIENGEHIYAAPSAVAFSRQVFVQAGSPSFDPTDRGDIGEELTYRCEERGIPVNLLLPTGYLGPMTWPLKGGMVYGHGTTYAGAIFHAFQIRFGVTQSMFIDKCREVCPDVTVAAVIVHRGEERLPLLRKAIDSLRAQDHPVRVVVVEQDATPRCRGEIEPMVDRYLFARSDGPFRKSWAFNVAVKSVEADFILLHDGDLAVPRDYVSRAVREIGDADVSTPWSCIAHLSPESTESYPSGERVVIDRMDSDWNKGASTLVRRSWYIEHKGMDERFQGWGAEDDAFVAKAKALGKYVRAQRDACVTLDHLYHKPRVRQSSRTIDMGDEPAPKADVEQYWRNYNTLKDDYGDPGRIAEIVAGVDGWGDPTRFGDGSIVTKRHTICLNMIVKDESHVIARCLDSVKPFIDYWVIVDTGSSDETPTIIRDVMSDVPGELFHKPWVDFAHNRNEAFALAKGKAEFIFTIDADEVLELPPGFERPVLDADCYSNTVRYDGVYYTRRQLFRSSLPWKYHGVVHEYLDCEGPVRHEFLNGVITVVYHEGARSRDPDTYKKDSVLLEKALADDPTNSRHAFYLAQSYRDAGRHEDAVEAYKRRAKMTPPDQETYHSLYQAGKLREGLNHPWDSVMADYLEAYAHAPYRSEPLYRIGLHYRAAGSHCLAELFFGRAACIQMPPAGALFVEYEVYTHLAAIEYAVACYWLGNHQEAIRVNKLLLGRGLPRPELTQLVQANLKFSLDAVGATS